MILRFLPLLFLLLACTPKDSEVFGIKQNVVAYERVPIVRSNVKVINMNDRVRIVVQPDNVFIGCSAKFVKNYRIALKVLDDFIENNKILGKVVITGYPSKQQADAIAAYIWALGVPIDLIKVKTSKSLVSDPSSASGRVDNRRLNIDFF